MSSTDTDHHCAKCGGHLYSDTHAYYGCVGFQRLQIEENQRQLQAMSVRLDFVSRLGWHLWNESILPPDLKQSGSTPASTSRDLFNQSR